MRGELESFDFDLLGAAGKLELIELYREPLNVSSLRVQGSATADFSTVRIEQAIVDLGDVTALAEATLEPVGEGEGLRCRFPPIWNDFEMRELHRFWPVSAATESARMGDREHLRGNRRQGNDRLALILGGGRRGVALEKLEGTLAYTDLGISYFKKMTPVVGIDGAGTFDRHGFYLGADDGQPGRRHKGDRGEVDVVEWTSKEKARLVIDVKTEGPIVTALKVLDEDPLNYGDKLGFRSRRPGGHVQRGPAFRAAADQGADRRYAGSRRQGETDEEYPSPMARSTWRSARASLDLDLTRADMKLAGDVRLNGVPAEIVWREYFEGGGDFKRRFEVKASPDDAQRLALGLPDLSYWIEGAAPTELTYTGGQARADDLSSGRI